MGENTNIYKNINSGKNTKKARIMPIMLSIDNVHHINSSAD